MALDWEIGDGYGPFDCQRCGAKIAGPGICPGCDAAEQATQRRDDPEVNWGYSGAVCPHGLPLRDYCEPCEGGAW